MGAVNYSASWLSRELEMEGVRVMRVCGEDNKRDIIQLNKVLRTSYGPWSDHTLLHSPNNSVITLTRSSSRILQHLATQNPLIKTLIAHLQSHAHAHKESTLYSGMLTCKYIHYTFGGGGRP